MNILMLCNVQFVKQLNLHFFTVTYYVKFRTLSCTEFFEFPQQDRAL